MKKAFIIITFVSSLHIAYAQSSNYDSLKNLLVSAKDDSTKVTRLVQLSSVYLWSYPDSSLTYIKQAILLARQIQWDVGLSCAYHQRGWFYLIMGDYPQALHSTQECLKLAEKTKNLLAVAWAHDFGSEVYLEAGDYLHALAEEKKAKSSVDSYGERSISTELDTAMNFFPASCYISIFNGLANVYEKLNKTESALMYAQELDKAYKKLSGKKWAAASFILGNIYFKRGDYTTALNHYREGIALAMKVDNKKDLMDNCNGVAKVFWKMGQFDSSIIYANKVLETGKTERYLIAQRDAFKLIADDYKSKKKTDSLAIYLEKTITMNDSLFSQQKVMQLQSMAFNEDLRQQEEEQQRKQLQGKINLYSALAALVVFVIIGLLLYRNNRHKQRAYTLLQKQKQETDIQKSKAEDAYQELKATQAQLIQSEKMASLGELTAGIAHEIQNPLNFVNNFSEVNKEMIAELKNEIASGNLNEAETLANNIDQNEEKIILHGRRADAIVKGMLQHSRTSAGQKEPTDINAICDEYLRLAFHGLRAKDKTFNAKMETNFDATIGQINVVPQDIGRVLLNLVNNAFYAVAEKKQQSDSSYEPCVSIRTTKLADSVEIAVKDNGNGIPEKLKSKIFQPFFTTKPTGQGTGLGLSLAYDIVKAHGGEIKVQTKEGEGSEFILHLPMTEL